MPNDDVSARRPRPFATDGVRQPVKCTTVTVSSYGAAMVMEISKKHPLLIRKDSYHDFYLSDRIASNIFAGGRPCFHGMAAFWFRVLRE